MIRSQNTTHTVNNCVVIHRYLRLSLTGFTNIKQLLDSKLYDESGNAHKYVGFKRIAEPDGWCDVILGGFITKEDLNNRDCAKPNHVVFTHFVDDLN